MTEEVVVSRSLVIPFIFSDFFCVDMKSGLRITTEAIRIILVFERHTLIIVSDFFFDDLTYIYMRALGYN